jgi:spermidine synthase
VLAAAGTLAAAGPLFDGLYERLLYGRGHAGQRFREVVESRGGVAAVTEDGTIFGGGAYDGVYSTDLVHDVNGAFRAYAIPWLHASPKRVLVIGLSSGSWARIVASMPGVEHVTIVEISKGYLALLPRHAEVASLLADPKVTIEVDDGRRWLRRNEGARFDVVLQNTTQHWRGEATNLLSREYLELVRARLAPGGLFWFNSTWSKSAQRTAATVFPHAVRLHSFVGVSDAPIVPDASRWRDALLAWRIDGKRVLDTGRPEHLDRLETLFKAVTTPAAGHGPDAPLGLETRDALLARTRDARLTTDDNMGDEWR